MGFSSWLLRAMSLRHIGPWGGICANNFVCSAEESEVLFQALVGSFTLSICLGMVCCADILFDVQLLAEVLGKG